MKRKDWMLAVVILAAALLAAGLYRMSGGQNEGSYVRIMVDGRTFGEYLLGREADIDVEGHNQVSIRDGQVLVAEADCPDKICVRHAAVSRVGESIVCLPNRMIVEIRSGDGTKTDALSAVAE